MYLIVFKKGKVSPFMRLGEISQSLNLTYSAYSSPLVVRPSFLPFSFYIPMLSLLCFPLLHLTLFPHFLSFVSSPSSLPVPLILLLFFLAPHPLLFLHLPLNISISSSCSSSSPLGTYANLLDKYFVL